MLAGVGEGVQGTIAEYEVLEEAEPLVHRPVAGDHEAGYAVPVEDELVQVGGLLGREAVQV